MNEPRQRVCDKLDLAIRDLQGEGFRLDSIYPAEEPHTAHLTRGPEAVRLTTRPDQPPPPAELPEFRPEFVLTRAGGAAGQGRAGMYYRDLIPSRLGGRYIASHITIPDGGPVEDWVHYHRVRFQLIAVRAGWVRVVYEDQGDPFVMTSGDLVLQPPGIRHRVLESSPGLEVVEISCPALHETFADHRLALPNVRVAPERSFGGQRFVRYIASEAEETGVGAATAGLVDARMVQSSGEPSIDFPPHDGELVFGFVIHGSALLEHSGRHELGPADAFVIPPGVPWTLGDLTDDFRLLRVTTAKIPGDA